jgi:hypothetical protein
MGHGRIVADLALARGRKNPQSSRSHAGDPEADAWPAWLGEEPADELQLKALLARYPTDDMICWLVSARVGNVRNNDSSLIEPVAAA